MTEAAIEIHHLSKTYQGAAHAAVDNISFRIPAQSIFGLLGPNGAGKTTTISMLCGLIRPSSGEINILGQRLSAEREHIKKMIGIVPQEIALYPSLTAFENLRYIGNMYGLRGKELQERIRMNLDIVGLSAYRDVVLSKFSGGMKRRINLLAGILHDPKLLFLDEPTVGVDVQSRSTITEHLHLLNQKGMTIVYTSHLMEEAEQLCSHIAIIDNGKLITSGHPKALIQEHGLDNLEHLFLKLTGKKLRD